VTALAEDRNTPRSEGDLRSGPVAASMLIYAGALVCRNAAGYLVKGAAATGLVGVGRAEQRIDNSAGANGALTLTYRPGIYRFGNSAAADLITIAEVGDVCFVVDDQTVAKTDGTSARSAAGIVDSVDSLGVWVRMDEALTHTAVAAAV